MTREPNVELVLEREGAGFTYFRRHASSLDLRLLLPVFGSLALLSLIIATGFAVAGAWLVLPFAGVEIAALGTAACVILRRAGDFERLAFQGDCILVEVRERGLARQFEFHRGWAQLVTGITGSGKSTTLYAALNHVNRPDIKILTAENGDKAIDIYKKDPSAIDVVLLDMTMPVMNGVETFKALKKINPDVKVILTSGYSADEVKLNFDDSNELMGFLEKPFTAQALSEKIRAVIMGKATA